MISVKNHSYKLKMTTDVKGFSLQIFRIQYFFKKRVTLLFFNILDRKLKIYFRNLIYINLTEFKNYLPYKVLYLQPIDFSFLS